MRRTLETLLIVFVVNGALLAATRSANAEAFAVLVDDYAQQPLQGEEDWIYNRLGGDRGVIGSSSLVVFGTGEVSASLPAGGFVGSWTALSHVNTESGVLDFSAIFPAQVLAPHQGSVTGIRVEVIDGSGTLKLELKSAAGSFLWVDNTVLAGGSQTVAFSLPALGSVHLLNWVLEGSPGAFVQIDSIELLVDVPIASTAQRAFLWSYSMLLSNHDPISGFTRDRANSPSGDFDNVSATGLQAAAAAVGQDLGFISTASAIAIVEEVTAGLLGLTDCNGLWPHFLTNGQITAGTEYSSVDTVIALVALLQAREALGLDTSAVESFAVGIDYATLLDPSNRISHGYDELCSAPLVATWFDFGTETWLVNLGLALATGSLAAMDASPPTFNGSGFIDELAWLLVPAPDTDHFGIDWKGYRASQADAQLDYFQTQHPGNCLAPNGHFGLSAGEVPDPAAIVQSAIYQTFGLGGTIAANDGVGLLGHPVATPHYSAILAGTQPVESQAMWNAMIAAELFSPLNNVESFGYLDAPTCSTPVWNSLKGSLNLSFQALGWGALLSGGSNPLYGAVFSNETLRSGYRVIAGTAVPAMSAPIQGLLAGAIAVMGAVGAAALRRVRRHRRSS